MYIRVDLLKYGIPVEFKGVIGDAFDLEETLGATPSGEFTYLAVCTQNDLGVLVELTVEGNAYYRCDDCGEMTIARCTVDLDEQFDESSEEYDFSKRAYDISELIREAVIMSSPRSVKCKADCKGLCPTCGQNLNVGKCKCEDLRTKVSPFAALTDLINTGGCKDGCTKK